MAITYITSPDSFGEAFNRVNNNTAEQFTNIQLVGSDLVITKFNNDTITVTLPISQGIVLLSPVGSITLGSISGSYNTAIVSAFDYLLDGDSYSVSSATTLTLTNGDSTLDYLITIYVDTVDNTVKQIAGATSTNPVMATIDTATQLVLGVVYVKATASETNDLYSLIYTAFKSQEIDLQVFQGQIKNNLSELLDVAITSPLNEEVLTYDSTINKWINKAVVSSSGGTGTYELDSPSTVTVGGLSSGYNLYGKGIDVILRDMLVVYQPPTFDTFTITSQDTTIEVGTALSGTKTFTWSTTDSTNVSPNTIKITNVNTSTDLSTGLANDGSEAISIGTIANSTPISQVFRIAGTNTNSGTFTKDYTIVSKYPIFYGTYPAPGSPGSGRLTNINFLLANYPYSQLPLTTDANSSFDINFNSNADDYIWFAVPIINTIKANWLESSFNFGDIGGSVTPSGNLFPAPATPLVNSPDGYWSGVQYRFYNSNYQTSFSTPMTISN